jgi:ribosome recycling factor
MPLPEMSRERRLEFVKVAHRLAEEGRVHIRNMCAATSLSSGQESQASGR